MANGFGHYILLTSVLTHSIIWLEYGFLCVLFKTIYSMPLPFHLFDYFLQVLDFASLASGKVCTEGLSLDSQSSDIYHKTWYTLLLYYSVLQSTPGIFASFLLYSSCRLGSLEYKNMQRMHVTAVQLQNDINYIIYISYTSSDLIQEYPGPSKWKSQLLPP